MNIDSGPADVKSHRFTQTAVAKSSSAEATANFRSGPPIGDVPDNHIDAANRVVEPWRRQGRGVLGPCDDRGQIIWCPTTASIRQPPLTLARIKTPASEN